MKSTAVLRIIIWSVTAIALTALMIAIILAGGFKSFGSWSFGISGENYKNSERYTTGGGNITEKINILKINWVGGKITVEAYGGDSVEISETGADSEDNRLRYLAENGALTIHYSKSGVRFGLVKYPDKDLTVKIPESLAENLKELEIDSSSADIYVNGIDTEKLSIDTVSGSANADGAIKSIEVESVSGNVEITSLLNLNSVEAESVSGDITLNIPKDNGFRLQLDTVSGKFNCNLPLTENGDEKTYLNRYGEFDIETVSGDISIMSNLS